MGTLARFLAEKQIPTPEDRYQADVEGDIENVNNVLRITQIRVTYRLKVPRNKVEEAKGAFSSYLTSCPAAQSVIGCIKIHDDLKIEEIAPAPLGQSFLQSYSQTSLKIHSFSSQNTGLTSFPFPTHRDKMESKRFPDFISKRGERQCQRFFLGSWR